MLDYKFKEIITKMTLKALAKAFDEDKKKAQKRAKAKMPIIFDEDKNPVI